MKAKPIARNGALILAVLSLSLVLQGVRLEAAPTGGLPADAQSTSGPTPPHGITLDGTTSTSPEAVVIANVPAYLWHHGCGPTAAGMVIGYWDGQGFDDLVAGSAATQTAAVEAMVASEGPASNYTDYCLPLDNAATHPSPLADKSEPPIGDEHADDCIADFMYTSQSYRGNYYGWSWFSAVGPALEEYVELSGTGSYQATVGNLYILSDLTWDTLRGEIDAGRPLVFLVDTDGNGGTDHFVTVIGYDEIGGIQLYACLNTWDTDVHWFEFAPMAYGQPWGVFGATTFRITGPVVRVYLPTIVHNP